ncbi:zinc ribbon domain-containing protein [Eubacteriaceae bacterium ES2]|nr:zinc ribbon domain-containing protein [Eubacteriaceae bacterium ES2]
MGKICPNCKKEIDTQAHFCTNCGYQFDSVSKEIVNQNDTITAKTTPVKSQRPGGIPIKR